jgi:hypothetical protein
VVHQFLSQTIPCEYPAVFVTEVEGRIVGDRLDQVQRLSLGVGKTRNLGVALGVTDVPADIEHPGGTGHVVEDGQREVRGLARRLLVVAIPVHGLIKHLEDVRTACEDLVVDGE